MSHGTEIALHGIKRYNLDSIRRGDIKSLGVLPRKSTLYRVGHYDNIFNDDRMSLYVELGFENSEDLDNTDYLQKF